MTQWDIIYQKEGTRFSTSLDLLQGLIPYFRHRKVKNILDVGCGIGKQAIFLSKQGFKVTGIDISPQAIKLAKQQAKAQNVSVRFLPASMYNLPFNNRRFDALISLRTINHGNKDQVAQTISEMYRVLKNKGLVFVTVIKLFGRKKRLGITQFNKLPVEIIAPYTYLPLEGKEKGIVHFAFNKVLLLRFFKKFKIKKFWLSTGQKFWERYYCLLGEKRSTIS